MIYKLFSLNILTRDCVVDGCLGGMCWFVTNIQNLSPVKNKVGYKTSGENPMEREKVFISLGDGKATAAQISYVYGIKNLFLDVNRISEVTSFLNENIYASRCGTNLDKKPCKSFSIKILSRNLPFRA